MAFYIKQRSIVFFKKDSRPTFSKYSCIRSGLTRRKVILFAKHLEKLIASLQFVAKGVKYHRTLYSDLCHVNKLGSGWGQSIFGTDWHSDIHFLDPTPPIIFPHPLPKPKPVTYSLTNAPVQANLEKSMNGPWILGIHLALKAPFIYKDLNRLLVPGICCQPAQSRRSNLLTILPSEEKEPDESDAPKPRFRGGNRNLRGTNAMAIRKILRWTTCSLTHIAQKRWARAGGEVESWSRGWRMGSQR